MTQCLRKGSRQLLTVSPPQVEMVFWLLSMLANRDKEEMSRTLLALSSSQDSCNAMRKSGCVPLLVQILHEVPGGGGGPGETAQGTCSREAKSRASAALHNIIYSQQDEGQARREMRVLHMLEQIRTYCDSGWDWIESHAGTPSPRGTKTTGKSGFWDKQLNHCWVQSLPSSDDGTYHCTWFYLVPTSNSHLCS